MDNVENLINLIITNNPKLVIEYDNVMSFDNRARWSEDKRWVVQTPSPGKFASEFTYFGATLEEALTKALNNELL